VFETVLVEEDCVDLPVARRLKEAAHRRGGCDFRIVPRGGEEIEALKRGDPTIRRMKSVVVLSVREDFFFLKGGEGTGNPACDFQVEFAFGCPHRCAFCQDLHFLNATPWIDIYPDLGKVFEKVDRAIGGSTKEDVVVETGSFSDLLALEPYTGILKDLIGHWTSRWPSRSTLQFLTKSGNVKELLGLDPKGCVRVGMSVNLPRFTRAFALGTPAPERQKEILRALLAGGYRLHLSFSPVLYREGVLEEYERLIQETREFLEGCEGFSASDLTLEAITFFQRKGGEHLVRKHYPDQAEALLHNCEYRGHESDRIFGYGEPVLSEMHASLRRAFGRHFPESRVLFVS
jgi:spore photoproduct lyase